MHARDAAPVGRRMRIVRMASKSHPWRRWRRAPPRHAGLAQTDLTQEDPRQRLLRGTGLLNDRVGRDARPDSSFGQVGAHGPRFYANKRQNGPARMRMPGEKGISRISRGISRPSRGRGLIRLSPQRDRWPTDRHIGREVERRISPRCDSTRDAIVPKALGIPCWLSEQNRRPRGAGIRLNCQD